MSGRNTEYLLRTRVPLSGYIYAFIIIIILIPIHREKSRSS